MFILFKNHKTTQFWTKVKPYHPSYLLIETPIEESTYLSLSLCFCSSVSKRRGRGSKWHWRTWYWRWPVWAQWYYCWGAMSNNLPPSLGATSSTSAIGSKKNPPLPPSTPLSLSLSIYQYDLCILDFCSYWVPLIRPINYIHIETRWGGEILLLGYWIIFFFFSPVMYVIAYFVC